MKPISGSYSEEPVVFACEDDHLVAVLCRSPPSQTRATGVVIVVGGPQYRAGSHRQFVRWSRAFAQAGYPCLRFDVRGMGDSTGRQRHFTELTADIGAAVDTMWRLCPGLDAIAVCGLCDGASAALLYLNERQDTRVNGLILLNPWVRTDQTQARTVVKHYYLQRLLDGGFWKRLFTGKVGTKAMTDLLGNIKRARSASPGADSGAPSAAQAYPVRMAQALSAWQGRTLLALSGNDFTAKEFLECAANDKCWAAALSRPQVQRLDLPDADHTLSDPSERRKLEDTSVAWLSTWSSAGPAPTTAASTGLAR